MQKIGFSLLAGAIKGGLEISPVQSLAFRPNVWLPVPLFGPTCSASPVQDSATKERFLS
jgi:hypothetical protein